MDVVVVSLLSVALGGVISFATSSILNWQNHKRDLVKLGLEHKKEVQVFKREKYEQLVIKLYRLAYIAHEGFYQRSRNESINVSMETFIMLMTEVEALIMLHFPLLEENYKNFSKHLIGLYTELYAGCFEQCEVIKESFDREADILLESVKNYIDEYTQPPVGQNT